MTFNILIDARLYGLENTGIGRYLVNLVKQISLLDEKNSYIILLKNRYFNELKLPGNWKKVLCNYKHYSFEEQIKLPSLINKVSPDLAHFPHFNIPIFWKGKFVVTIHDMTMHQKDLKATKLSPLAYYFKRLPYKYVFRKAIKGSVKIITPTSVVKQILSEYYNLNEDKIVSIYEGVNTVYSKQIKMPSLKSKNKVKGSYFIYTGNLYPHKNIKSAIKAISLLNKNRKKKISLLIVCSQNNFLGDLEKYTQEVGVKEFVKFLGYVPDNKLAALYKKAVAFVYPSLSEGFGLQGLEAMAAGCPLIASDIPVFKEVYADHALYFDPQKPKFVAKAMRKILEMKKDKREKMVRDARNYVKKFSWKKTAKETLDVYMNIIDGTGK